MFSKPSVIVWVPVQKFRFEPLERHPVPSQIVIPLGPQGGMHMKVL